MAQISENSWASRMPSIVAHAQLGGSLLEPYNSRPRGTLTPCRPATHLYVLVCYTHNSTGQRYGIATVQAQIKHVDPYVLHTTYVYGEQHGKSSRIREAGLWLAEQPDYFDGPKFLSLDIQLPPVWPYSPPLQSRAPLSTLLLTHQTLMFVSKPVGASLRYSCADKFDENIVEFTVYYYGR